MEIMFLLVGVSLFLGLFFLGAFFWAMRQGQFEDLETPAYRILFFDNPETFHNDKGKEKN